ncbi:unnamed protein product [Brachionus calyciflorus]|uniref:HTH CENPB-type domain-containing protein n=1 Tax=Brachionus calyciflorus TaxID=104777 RepID=A0A813WWV1_9BILA|nr:unnamed protein product [Brachionus calyciflorus]
MAERNVKSSTISKRKKNELNVQQKKLICQFYVDNPKIKQSQLIIKFSKEFGYPIPKSTLHDIVVKKDIYLSMDSSNCYRIRSAKYPELEDCLHIWFCEKISTGITLNDQIMLAKAEYFGTLLDISDLTYSVGWLDNFKKRHGISSYTLHGEAGSTNQKDVRSAREKLQQDLKSFKPEDIFNFDESALFFRMGPNKTLAHRKVCLLVDNASSHKPVELSNVTVKYLPPNMTSSIQPLDAGMIFSFKSHYKKKLVNWFLEQIEEFNTFELPELDQAIRMVRRAWLDVSPKTIVNCWEHCDILPQTSTLSSRPPIESIEKDSILSFTELLERFKTKYYHFDKNCEFESAKEYLNAECLEQANEDLSDEEILDLVLGTDKIEELDSLNPTESIENQFKKTTYKEVLDSLNVINNYLNSLNAKQNLIDDFEILREKLSDLRIENLNQGLIDNFFKKI